MPKFFFDLVDDKTIFDKKGVSLPNEKEARRYAITFARELMQTQPELFGRIVAGVVRPSFQREIR